MNVTFSLFEIHEVKFLPQIMYTKNQQENQKFDLIRDGLLKEGNHKC